MNSLYIHLVGLFMLFLTVVIFIIFCVKLSGFFIQRKRFPKKLLIASLAGVIVISALFLYQQYFFTFNKLEGELYKGPLNSPNGKYTANAYYMTYGGAAGGVNLWVEITYNNENDKKKTIYYSEAKSNFSMEWKNEDTLNIVNVEPKYPNSNGSIELEVAKEIYDENGLACKSLLMKDTYETCYQN
ncbi:DUF5412 family protein [Paenibacillus pini]|uniref:Uncharacterized protein n=1 Tax=Paenibacillus pini JCM 16418 TaxID=1236976 RepID=W7YT88_9BACL|nr:DUF5412 family protein [Paenibacillus pini]GAF07841.1 hypothetical protein JCM16418_1872 [Paenibacillus pini JCM 16418]